MTMSQDEEEHSIEMELPYLRKVCEGCVVFYILFYFVNLLIERYKHRKDIKIVPILVGDISKEEELLYGEILAPYLAQEGTVFIASSDFCHWFVHTFHTLGTPTPTPLTCTLCEFRGQRFLYTFYYPKQNALASEAYEATRAMPPREDYDIWESITQLDQKAMHILSMSDRTAQKAHTDFHRYLKETKNSICGRHAIGVLYGALAYLERTAGKTPACKWVKYDQSTQCTSLEESSVSYASGWIKL